MANRAFPSVGPAPRAHERYSTLLRLMTIAEKIREKGWLIDSRALSDHVMNADKKVRRYTKLCLELTGLRLNDLGAAGTGATHTIRDWFWLKAGAPHVVFNKLTKRPQFSTECLVIYATDFRREPFGPAAAALYGLRKNKKLLQFLDAYRRLSMQDGRIHFSFNPAGTQTGRWTSSTRQRVLLPDGTRTTYSANAQQVPKKTPSFDFGDGPEVLVDSLRDIFIADPGHVLIRADYDALELRLIAYVYGAQKIIAALNEGRDTHMMNAEEVFIEMNLKSADAKICKAARTCAKTLAYAVSYQMHDERGGGKYPTLFKALKKEFPTVVEQQANIYAERFFQLHPEIKAGQSSVRRRVDELGFNELTIDGRRLYYPSTMRGYNQALNFSMQGTGSALVNRALIELDKHINWQGQEVRAQVHDELVVQAPESEVAQMCELVERCMGAPAQIGRVFTGIPAAADVGPNWHELCPLDQYLSEQTDGRTDTRRVPS